MTEVLRADDLHVRFQTEAGHVKAVNGVSFSLAEGTILCLVGESGAGKSTTALAILSLLPENAEVMSGSVRFGEIDLLTVRMSVLRDIRGNKIAVISQDPRASLNPALSIGDQIVELIRAHTELKKREARELAMATMKEMGLPDPKTMLKRYAFQLSGGACQRVVLSMAMALRPKVIIADEPTSSLDVTLQAEILDILKKYCRESRASMILITHDMGVVAQMADDVAVMYAGDIVEYARVYDLFKTPHHPYTWGLLQSVPRLDRPDMRMEPIKGSPPDMVNMPDQCPFVPRCPKANNTCRLEPRPQLQEVAHGHRVACYNSVDYSWKNDFYEG